MQLKKNRAGLVSISFRDKTPKEILSACRKAGLSAIEWGGDIHVPHGEKKTAETVRKMTEEAGLSIAEYGSYYHIGDGNAELFDKVLTCADALHTDCIRVWAGKNIPSAEYPTEDYRVAVSDARRICSLAGDKNIALECHPYSLTDDCSAAVRFLTDVGCENLKMLWQPNQYRSEEYNINAARLLLPYLVGVHVFSWSSTERFPLAYGEEAWKRYLEVLSARPLSYLLEFMPDDKIETLPREAETLRMWLAAVG